MRTIDLGRILILIFIVTVQMIIYYQVLTKPLLEELKKIKEKLTQLTQKEEKKSKDE